MNERLATDAELLAEVTQLEAELARLRYRQLAVLAELNARNVPGTLGFRGLPELISVQARCTRAEARKRSLAVERFGARRGLTGEELQPVYPDTATALSVGEVGVEHAAEIADTVEAIPAAERAEHAVSVEATLLEHARTSDPRTVRLLGQRILAHLDPDGPSPQERRLQQTHRRVDLVRHPTGWASQALSPASFKPGWQRLASPLVRMRTARPGAVGPTQPPCMTRSRKQAAGSSPPVSCPTTPACPAS